MPAALKETALGGLADTPTGRALEQRVLGISENEETERDFRGVLPGVGKQKKEALAELGIHSIADLLSYFPYRYEDYRLSDLSEAGHEERVTVEGQIYGQPSVRWYGKKKSRMTLKTPGSRHSRPSGLV